MKGIRRTRTCRRGPLIPTAAPNMVFRWEEIGVDMGRFAKNNELSLSVEGLLEKSVEKDRVELRKRRIERSGFTSWRIWKLLRITWE
jgi:hypothetical protein